MMDNANADWLLFVAFRISDGYTGNPYLDSYAARKRQGICRLDVLPITQEIKVISIPLNPVAYSDEIWLTPS